MSSELNSVSAIAALDLRQLLIQLGVFTDEDLPLLGLTDAILLNPKQGHLPIQEQRVKEKDFLQLWKLADQHQALPHIGLLIGQHYHPESRGLLANWLFQCETLQHSLEVFIQHIPLMNPSEQWKINITPQETRLYIDFKGDKPYPRAAIERSMTTLLVWCKELTGKPAQILEVKFTGAKPEYHPLLQDFFDTEIKYNQDNNSILIPSDYLSTNIQSRNPYLEDMMKQRAGNILVALQPSNDLIEKIKQIILNNLDNIPDIHTISQQLNLSRATLYRQLKSRDTTYSALVVDIQKNKAREWLNEGKTITAISIDLGFADTSAFYKAFKRWFGITPTEFQAR